MLTNFAMMQHHKYSLSDINEMMPWERDVYVSLLNDYIAQEEERIRDNQQSNGFLAS